MMHGGMENFFASNGPSSLADIPNSQQYGGEAPEPEMEDLLHTDDIEDHVCNIVLNMLNEVEGNDVLMRHLLVGIL